MHETNLGVALVTGASSGIGHATDRYYVQDDEAAKQRAIKPLPLAETTPVQDSNWQQVGNALPNSASRRIANDR